MRHVRGPDRGRAETKREMIEAIIRDDISSLIDSVAGKLMPILRDAPDPCLIGIQRRGDYLAQRLARTLAGDLEIQLPLGTLDITLYRDDFDSLTEAPVVGQTDIPFSVDGRTVILVDDVLFTGRTIRAALDEILEFGRPSRVLLAVLVDRGWRELPIAADVVGLSLETALDDSVQVLMEEVDGRDAIQLFRSVGQQSDE